MKNKLWLSGWFLILVGAILLQSFGLAAESAKPKSYTVKKKQITVGMSQKEVKKALGNYQSSGDDDGVEYWTYEANDLATNLGDSAMDSAIGLVPIFGGSVSNQARTSRGEKVRWTIYFKDEKVSRVSKGSFR